MIVILVACFAGAEIPIIGFRVRVDDDREPNEDRETRDQREQRPPRRWPETAMRCLTGSVVIQGGAQEFRETSDVLASRDYRLIDRLDSKAEVPITRWPVDADAVFPRSHFGVRKRGSFIRRGVTGLVSVTVALETADGSFERHQARFGPPALPI